MCMKSGFDSVYYLEMKNHLKMIFIQLSILFLPQVVLTSMELLKKMAVEGGASSLQSVELQVSLEEMMELC